MAGNLGSGLDLIRLFELRHPSPCSRYNESGVLPPNKLQAIREDMTKTHQHPLEKILESRIAIIDGAMGTTIRTYGMKEADIRGERFKDSKKDLLNNGDLFSLTQPEMIGDIHRRFLEAGADIIETNTFGATSITQSEFFVDDPREHGGRKDPEFYQKIIEDSSSAAWRGRSMSNRRGSAGNGPIASASATVASTVCGGSDRAADRVSLQLARCR